MEHITGQNIDEWYAARATKLTASRFGVICGVSKYALPRSLFELLTGRMIGDEVGETDITRFGHETEVESRIEYENLGGHIILPGNFWTHVDYDWLGASPDGVICDPKRLVNKLPPPLCCAVGLWENKSKVFQMSESVPLDHLCQVQGQLEIVRTYADRSLHYDWCDYTVYFKEKLRRVYRVYRSPEFWAWMLPRLIEFKEALDQNPQTLKLSDIGPPPKCRIDLLFNHEKV